MSKQHKLIRWKQVFVMAHSALLMGSLELGLGVQLTPGTQAGILEASKVRNILTSHQYQSN
jgi:hypothetical protein